MLNITFKVILVLSHWKYKRQSSYFVLLKDTFRDRPRQIVGKFKRHSSEIFRLSLIKNTACIVTLLRFPNTIIILMKHCHNITSAMSGCCNLPLTSVPARTWRTGGAPRGSGRRWRWPCRSRSPRGWRRRRAPGTAGRSAPSSGGNCIKMGLPGRSILGDYFLENRTSRGPLLLLKITFPGRPIFIQFVPGKRTTMTPPQRRRKGVPSR